MTDTETLTAALRRLADEHASGLLSVATPGRDVVLELADGVPVGIGPTHDVSDRVGREASAELVAAAVIDGLVDRTVAAIVGGGGDWVWDVADSAAMMPVPPNLAVELSRRAVDAAQALATLATDQVLAPARDLETHGEVDRVRALFDGERTVEDVAELSGLTVPAVATLAAALVAAGVLSTGQEEAGPVSWTDAVAGSSTSEDEDEDEPELWVMDPPDEDEDDEDHEDDEDDEDDEDAAAAGDDRDDEDDGDDEDAAAAGDDRDDEDDGDDEAAPAAHTGGDQATAPRHGAAEAPASEDPPARPTPIEQRAAPQEEPTAPPEAPAAATEPVGSTAAASVTSGAAGRDDDDWSDTTWLDELDTTDGRSTTTAGPNDHRDADESGESRAALSAMISELQRPDETARTAPAPASRGNESRPEVEPDDTDAAEQGGSSEARRKEPKAAPGEVAEFLRELSRLALDDE